MVKVSAKQQRCESLTHTKVILQPHPKKHHIHDKTQNMLQKYNPYVNHDNTVALLLGQKSPKLIHTGKFSCVTKTESFNITKIEKDKPLLKFFCCC